MSNQSITLATFYHHARGLKMLQYEYNTMPCHFYLLLHGTFRLIFVWHRLVLYRLVIPRRRTVTCYGTLPMGTFPGAAVGNSAFPSAVSLSLPPSSILTPRQGTYCCIGTIHPYERNNRICLPHLTAAIISCLSGCLGRGVI